MNDDQIKEVAKGLAAMLDEWGQHGGNWIAGGQLLAKNIGAYKRFKWVQFHPIRSALELAIVEMVRAIMREGRNEMMKITWELTDDQNRSLREIREVAGLLPAMPRRRGV